MLSERATKRNTELEGMISWNQKAQAFAVWCLSRMELFRGWKTISLKETALCLVPFGRVQPIFANCGEGRIRVHRVLSGKFHPFRSTSPENIISIVPVIDSLEHSGE